MDSERSSQSESAGQCQPGHALADRECDSGADHLSSFEVLVRWAREKKALFKISRLGDEFDRAGEHVIYNSEEGVERVFKVTHPGQAGLVLRALPGAEGYNVTHRAAVPAEYLERMIISNEIWGDEVFFEGLIEGDLPSLVISQPRLEGPHPPALIINEFLRSQGFERKDTLMWYRPLDGLAISDTKPSNFIQTPAGDILPIDIPVRFASAHMAEAWGEPLPPASLLRLALIQISGRLDAYESALPTV